MSVFTEKRTPYEFLVRWGTDGEIQGAHVGFLDTVLKDGEVISQTPTNVESVAIGAQNGFPISQILDQTLADALKEIDSLRLELQGVMASRDELSSALDEARLNLASAHTENESLKVLNSQLQADTI